MMSIVFSSEDLPKGWTLLTDTQSINMVSELEAELCAKHELSGCKSIALARKDGRDDFLFQIEGANQPLYVVHLTWQKESSPSWPTIESFTDKRDFIENWYRIYD